MENNYKRVRNDRFVFSFDEYEIPQNIFKLSNDKLLKALEFVKDRKQDLSIIQKNWLCLGLDRWILVFETMIKSRQDQDSSTIIEIW